jgi:retron-type reverse transcriptase
VCADGRVLGLVEELLKQGVIEGMDWQEAKRQGTAQGGVVSPLLANIYLDPLSGLRLDERRVDETAHGSLHRLSGSHSSLGASQRWS